MVGSFVIDARARRHRRWGPLVAAARVPSSVTTLTSAIRKVTTTIVAMKPLLLALALAVSAAAHAKIDFIENDYATAVSRAKAKNVPVFVEAWAPW